MNQVNSCSHAIFVIITEYSEYGSDGQDHIHLDKFNMVDLASSERRNKSCPYTAWRMATQSMGSGGSGRDNGGREEASKISLSLSALGNIITALVGKRTLISPTETPSWHGCLELFGWECQATLRTVSYSYTKSFSTPCFAKNQAKNIKNKPWVKEYPAAGIPGGNCLPKVPSGVSGDAGEVVPEEKQQ